MTREIISVNNLDSERILPRHEAQGETQTQARPSKRLKHIKSTLDWSSAVLKVVSSTGAFLKNFSLATKVGLKCTKIPNVLSTPYTVKELIDNGKKVVYGKRFTDKIRGGLKSISNVDGIANSVASGIKILTTAKVISDSVGSWIPFFEACSFYISFISLLFKVETIWNTNKLRRDLNASMHAAKSATTELAKAQAWDTVLERVEKENVEDLRRKLSISKKADLAGRVHALRAALQSDGAKTKAIEDAAEFMKVLAPRVRKQFGYELTELINKVATTVGAALLTFTPFFTVGAVILLGTAVTSLVLMAGRAMLIHKNPFDEYSRSKAQAVLDAIIPSRKEALNLRKKVQELSAERDEAVHRVQEQEEKIRVLESRAASTRKKVKGNSKISSIATRIKAAPRERRPVERFAAA